CRPQARHARPGQWRAAGVRHHLHGSARRRLPGHHDRRPPADRALQRGVPAARRGQGREQDLRLAGPQRGGRRRAHRCVRRRAGGRGRPYHLIKGDRMDLSRRDLLAAGGLTLAGAALAPRLAGAQTPKRGGTLALRLWDPPHFDLHGPGGLSYKLHIPLTFTHSRLVKPKAGPNVQPGTFPLEGDLAESWTQPSETTYVFKLRRGVKWQPKPPVNGRELTADDVVYSVNRFLTTKGNANAFMLGSLDKVEAVDKYTVKFTLKEPFAWFLDTLANPMAVAIVAKECVDKFGDLKKWESFIGTGPWMLDSYRPNQGMTLVRNPSYFVPGLPYIDRVEITVDEDNASRISSFLSGKYDVGWENPGIINRTDWVQIKDKVKRPVRTAEFPANVMSHISMRTDQKPFS